MSEFGIEVGVETPSRARGSKYDAMADAALKAAEKAGAGVTCALPYNGAKAPGALRQALNARGLATRFFGDGKLYFFLPE